MAMGLGATMCGFNSFSVRDGTLEVGDLHKDLLDPVNREVRYRSMFFTDEVLCRQPWLALDKACNRLPFIFFRGGVDYIEQWSSNIEMGCTGHRKYVIFDDNAFENHAKGFGQQGARMVIKPEWLIPIEQGPFYGACMGGPIQQIQTGLRINADAQVTRENKEPIPGLYAGYHTAGGATGDGIQGGTIFSCVGKSAAGGWMTSKGVLKNEC